MKIPYGFTQHFAGALEIVPEQAAIIQEIYRQYLSGKSLGGVVDFLLERQIPSPSGRDRWGRSVLDGLLSNAKYIGGIVSFDERLKYIHETTLDNLTYIGEWHSHPSANTQRSTDDVKLHNAIVGYNRENCLPGCMMILGTDNFSIFIDE